MIAFKIDENLPLKVCELLRRGGFDALTVVDQNLGGHPDTDVAAVCRSEGRVLLTFDSTSQISRALPASYAGIIVFRLTRHEKVHVVRWSMPAGGGCSAQLRVRHEECHG